MPLSPPITAPRFVEFVASFSALLSRTRLEPEILEEGRLILARLVARDDWLPHPYAKADPLRYRQYLLHLDPAERFSVVSFVWAPGQATPVHDHRTWGLIGVLRGAERSERFALSRFRGLEPVGVPELLEAGLVEAVSPAIGDVHRVSNPLSDQISISIHVYGGNIGRIERATYDVMGRPKRFVSGYANAQVAA